MLPALKAFIDPAGQKVNKMFENLSVMFEQMRKRFLFRNYFIEENFFEEVVDVLRSKMTFL